MNRYIVGDNMRKKTIVMITLAFAILIMTVGYAALKQELFISGTSSIDSRWKIEIIDITESDIVGDASSKENPTYTATTANFKVSLINPTDSITYNVKIKNTGTIDAKIESLNISNVEENDAITYEASLVKSDGSTVQLMTENIKNNTNIANTKDTVLEANKEQTIKVKVSFKTGYIGQPTDTNNSIKLVVNYIQKVQNSNNH